MIKAMTRLRKPAVTLALVLLMPSFALVGTVECAPALESVSGEDYRKLYQNGEDLAQAVLGDFNSRAYVASPLEAKVIFTNWKRQASHYVSGLRGDPKIRADVYESFAKEISRRANLLKANSGIEVEWDYQRVRLPSGTEIFYGKKGYFFEVGRFDTCYGGKFMTPPEDGKLPYTDDDQPISEKFRERTRIDPYVSPA